MDLIFKRYSSPFLLVDESIRTGSMKEFIGKLIDIVNQENEDETLWEFFLHKVWDMTFEEFFKKVKKSNEPEKPVDFEAAINNSINILNDFVPKY